MTIDIDATYRDGSIHPDTPLNLPDNTPVRVRIVTVENDATIAGGKPRVISTDGLTREQIIALRPKSPRLTPEEFDAIIDKYCVSVGTLPPDFSREDIYNDHD